MAKSAEPSTPPTDQERVDSTLSALDLINPGPFGSTITNSGVVHKIGGAVAKAGTQDFTAPGSPPITEDTMFGEGSIGKVRFAGLAYMLQQEKIIDLKQNAKEFFEQPKVRGFLDAKYPRQGVSGKIIALLSSEESSKATLADLTTHHSGIGDLTRAQARLFAAEGGVSRNYTLSDLLSVIPADGKLKAQAGGDVRDEDLPAAKHGVHQYSNLGYMVLGAAMEAAYFDKTGKEKTYQELTDDFMLHPKEGRAKGSGLEFNSTRFPAQIKPEDNVVKASLVDAGGAMIDSNKFSGANAAGGMFASANDSSKFFAEYFRGFPGTAEHGREKVNKFFTKETIELMQEQWKKSPAGFDKAGNIRYQGAGFGVTVSKDEPHEVLGYDKTGDTFGYISSMKFDPKAGAVDISMIARENVSDHVAKTAGVKIADLVSAYKDGAKPYDRTQMYADHKRDFGLIMDKVSRSKGADMTAALTSNAVAAPPALAAPPTPSKLLSGASKSIRQ